MTRTLLVQSASPHRIRRAAEALLASDPRARVTIASAGSPQTLDQLRALPGVRVVSLRQRGMVRTLLALRAERFDQVRVFWAGGPRYRRLKTAALLLGRRATLIDNGDGGLFRLTPGSIARHARFRRSHPYPSDHWELAELDARDETAEAAAARPADEPARHPGERVLVLESAHPSAVARALDRLWAAPVFRNPRYTVFCRNRPEGIARFRAHPAVAELRVHDETRGSLGHLVELRRERFDGLVLFLTGDPSYWKMKWFAFLLGPRHRLVFNENNDCFFFSWGRWASLVSHRLGERSRLGAGRAPRWLAHAGTAVFLTLKIVLVPARVVWLLLIWLRLRVIG